MHTLCVEGGEERPVPELREQPRRDPAGEPDAAAGEDRERMVAHRRAEAFEKEIDGGPRYRVGAGRDFFRNARGTAPVLKVVVDSHEPGPRDDVLDTTRPSRAWRSRHSSA